LQWLRHDCDSIYDNRDDVIENQQKGNVSTALLLLEHCLHIVRRAALFFQQLANGAPAGHQRSIIHFVIIISVRIYFNAFWTDFGAVEIMHGRWR
jgi:hypothetical protein